MTATELRNKIVKIANSYVGVKKGSAEHKQIIAEYNKFAKAHGLALAYESYDWCAIFNSVVMILAGIGEYVPISMSCGQIITQAKKLGYWKEDDGTKPKAAMSCIYDWEDDGKGDDTTGHDHIGVVVSAGDKTFSVVEGNAGSPSQVRKISRQVNQRYIRGFVAPDYSAIAKKLTPKEEPKPAEPAKEPAKPAEPKQKEVKATQYAKSFSQSYNKSYKTFAKAGLNLRDGAGTKYKVLTVMPNNSAVRCYGYYTMVSGKPWLYVQYKSGDTLYTGFCTKEYLK